MRVQAIAEGYYNGLQKVGAIFLLEDKENADGEIVKADTQFSKRWMVEIDANGNPVKGTPETKAELVKQADKPVKNLAEKSTPSKGDNGTDIEALKERLEDADKAEDEGLDDGKSNEGVPTNKPAPARRSRAKVEDTEAKKAETAAAADDAKEASEDADDTGDDNSSADDADADKAPAEEGSRRRRRRG